MLAAGLDGGNTIIFSPVGEKMQTSPFRRVSEPGVDEDTEVEVTVGNLSRVTCFLEIPKIFHQKIFRKTQKKA